MQVRAWIVRERARLQKEKEERERTVKEKEDVERRRQMSDAEIIEENKKSGEPPRRVKGKMKFMQKYYHPGAFAFAFACVACCLFDSLLFAATSHLRCVLSGRRAAA